MRRAASIDWSCYARAFVVLARNPAIVLGPLAAAALLMLVVAVFPTGDGAFGLLDSIVRSLFATFVRGMGLAFALAVADAAWSYGKSSVRDAWRTVERRMGDIFMAALGLSFVVYLAQYVGGLLASTGLPGLVDAGPLLLGAVAQYFLIFTMPAAAIGGVPGGAALNASVEKVRSAPWPALALVIVYYVAYALVQPVLTIFAGNLLIGYGVAHSIPIASALVVVVESVVAAYFATVLAKTYNDISYRRPW